MSDWTVINDSDADAESPVDEDLALDLKENVEYLFERALRGGTHATGVRRAFACGAFTDTASTDGGGETGQVTQAITFATDAADGDPNFSAAPIVVFTLAESAGHSDWGTGYQVQSNIQEGTPSATGFTVVWELFNGPTSTTVGAIIHWMAFGAVTSGE